jgi:uncharacterized protein (TIGR02246 family)
MFYLLDTHSSELEKQMFTLPTSGTTRITATDARPTTDPADVAAPIVKQAEKAWNDADGAAFGALFADEMDFVNVRGEHHRGDGAYIGRAHQGIFDSIYAGSTVSFRLDIARVLAPGVVLAVASSTLDVPQGPLQGIHHARMTMVIAAQDGDWRITAFHNTLVADAG